MFNNLHNFLFFCHFYLLYRFPYDILLLYACTPQSRVLTFSVGRPAFCCVRENHEKGNKNIMGTAFLRQLQQEFKGYNGQKLAKDLMAGLTVAAVGWQPFSAR